MDANISRIDEQVDLNFSCPLFTFFLTSAHFCFVLFIFSNGFIIDDLFVFTFANIMEYIRTRNLVSAIFLKLGWNGFGKAVSV